MQRWLETAAELEQLAALCRQGGRIGFDTETTGHNVKESSPAFRATVDVWSVALPHPNGYHGLVLPRSALERGPMRAVLEDPGVEKVAHNAGHDLHAAANHGVRVVRVTDTLAVARLVWPGLESYTLKALRVRVLKKPERVTFKGLTEWDEPVEKHRVECVCCKKGCRKRTYPHVQYTVPVPRTRHVTVDVADIGPDHPRWPLKLDYAAEDAEDAPELLEAALERLDALCSRLPELPW